MDQSKVYSSPSRNRLSDRDILLDLLVTEKHLAALFNQGVLEAASAEIADTFERLQTMTQDNARTIFSVMQQRGWYNPERTSRSERRQTSRRNQMADTFNTAANSRYAVSSGSRKFGRHLLQDDQMGKSGIFTSQRSETQSQQDWQ